MKFSSSLKFNAVAEWWDEYIAYDALKKHIYQLEKTQDNLSRPYHDLESNERTSLMGEDHSTSDAVFVPLLDKELKKISLFYEQQEKELLDELEELDELVRQHEDAGLSAGNYYMDDDGTEDEEDEDEEDAEDLSRSQQSKRRPRKSSSVANSQRPPKLSPVRRRTSSSSDEDTTHVQSAQVPDLENSLASLNPPKSAIGRLAQTLHIGSRERDAESSPAMSESVWTARNNYAYDTRLLFKRRITTLYISMSSLKSYVEVNYSGFRKILKKYDKVTYSELKDRYLHDVVEHEYAFSADAKAKLADALNRLLTLYAKCITRGDVTLARQQLKLHQRENIAWERDTVWRQMIGRERRGEGDLPLGGGGISSLTGGGGNLKGSLVKNTEDEPGLVELQTRLGKFKLKKKQVFGLLAAIVFVTLLNVKAVEGVEANRCFAILVFSTIMWATEAIPLFVTSMLVPLLLVCLKVIRDDDGAQLSTPNATKYVFSIMFSPTIMLLIGGFTISSALSKTNIDRVIITKVLSFAGSKPSLVLLAFMGVSCFASMWISNVAAPTLCFTLIRPILRTLPPKSSFAPCLILAIALAANIGGQSSPISSPQNLIALQAMDPAVDWGTWFAVALPVSAISILLIWLLLLVSYRPARSPDGEGDIEIKTIRPTKESFTLKQYWVTFVCLITIGLWCVEHSIEEYVGDMGVIAILPVVLFFGTGVLKKDDFEQFAWTIVFLAMGGIALGKGVMSSGLLEVMDLIIRDLVDGLSLYTVVLVLSPVVLVISTFISHTIASVLLVPIAKEVGSNLSGNHANLLIFVTGLICSAGMGMPVSGFPNQTAATQEDELGELYLTNMDFLKNGVPASIIATLVVSTVGFLLMKAVGL